MAKNWFDGPIPTPEIGILGGLPSLQLTEEDKRRAWAQMLMQGGLATAAASLGGANTGRALGTGLLGGAEAYGQGLQAPAARMDAYAKQLKMHGDQIGNAKGMEELAKLKRDASDYASKNDFLSMLNDPGRAAMLYGGGPSVQNEQRASQFGANPAMMLSDPRMNLKALQAGVDPKQLGAALENTRPFKMDPGAMYQYANGSREQIPQAQPGMTMIRLPDGSYTAQPIAGYNGIIKDQELNKNMGQNAARLWLEGQQRANTVVPQQMQSGKTEPVTAQAQLDYAKRNSPSVFQIPADVQARRDAIAQGIYNEEGAGQFSPRLNDRKGVPGIRPQVAGLDSPGGPSPVIQGATQEGIKASIDAIGKSKDKATESLNAALALQEATNAVKKGTYQGRFADWQTAGAALASAIPGLDKLVDPEKLANSQVASKHLAEQVLGRIKALGVNPSNADRDFIMKTIPMLTNDPAAFTRLTNYVQSMSLRAVDAHNAAADRLHATKGLSPDLIGMNYRIEVPQEIAQQRNAIKLLLQKGTPQERKQLRDMGYLD